MRGRGVSFVKPRPIDRGTEESNRTQLRKKGRAALEAQTAVCKWCHSTPYRHIYSSTDTYTFTCSYFEVVVFEKTRTEQQSRNFRNVGMKGTAVAAIGVSIAVLSVPQQKLEHQHKRTVYKYTHKRRGSVDQLTQCERFCWGGLTGKKGFVVPARSSFHKWIGSLDAF